MMHAPESGEATCGVCGAPALAVAGACAFCLSPLDAEGEPAPLLDYLAERLPGAEVGRGVFGRGRIRQLRVSLAGREFAAQLQHGGLELRPPLDTAAWVDQLVRALTEAAGSDVDARSALSRTGWAWR
jgi:hypothetical protein